MRINYIPAKKQMFATINFGVMYNFYAANGPISPAGWHLPSQAEWETLSATLGGDAISAMHMKEATFLHWLDPVFPVSADNTSGLSMKGGGRRDWSGTPFDGLMQQGWYWTADINNMYSTQIAMMMYNSPNISFIAGDPNYGFSIRLVKDDSVDTGSMIDYDGNVYPTKLVGSQVWMADNLIVQHYNTGIVIPNIVTDASWAANEAWMGKTEGALCAYNNDWSKV